MGASLSWAFQLKLDQITAVAIETSFQVSLTSASNTFNLSFQNGSIAFILLKMSFEEPLGELAAVAPVAQVRKYLKSMNIPYLRNSCLYCLSFIISPVNSCTISLSAYDNWTSFVAGTSSIENIPEVHSLLS